MKKTFLLKIKLRLFVALFFAFGIFGSVFAQPFTVTADQNMSNLTAVTACGANYTFSYTQSAYNNGVMTMRDNGVTFTAGWGTYTGCSYLGWGAGQVGNGLGTFTTAKTIYVVITSTPTKTITFYTIAPLCVPLLPNPTANAATSISTTGFTANWTTVANASSYTVKVYQGATEVVAARKTGLTGTSVAVSGLTINTTYTYTVTAIGDGTNYDDSNPSTAISVRTLNTANAITSFTLLGAIGTIDDVNKTISVDVPFSSDLSLPITPTVDVSPNATLLTTGAKQFYVGVPELFTVQAEDGTTQNYNVTVNKAAANKNADLSALSVSLGTLSPVFSASTLTYTVQLPFSNTTIPTVSATKANNLASVVINNATGFPGTATVVVTAEDVAISKTYTINFTKAPASQNADLSALGVSLGTLSPTFSANGLTYNVQLPFANTTIPTVSATKADNLASIVINNATAFPGSATVVVTAEDVAISKTYTVNFTKAPASTACDITSFSFSNIPPQDVSISATDIKVNVGASTNISNLIATIITSPLSTITTSPIPTNYTTPQQISVLAQDGSTSKTYTVTVIIDNTVPSLLSSSPSNGSKIVNSSGNITLTFSENVVIGTSGTVTLTNTTTNTSVILTPSSIPSTGSTTVTIPFSGLINFNDYTLSYTAGTFLDLASNQAVANSILFTKTDGSCSSTSRLVSLYKEDFGTFTDLTQRAPSPLIQTLVFQGVPNQMVNDGYYAILPSLVNGATYRNYPSNQNSWGVEGYDHTSTTTSYPSGTYGGMAFLNCGGTSGSILFTKEINVCANTNLTFSVWHAFASRDNAAEPNVTFNFYGEKSDGTFENLNLSESVNPKYSGTNVSWNQLIKTINSGIYTTIKFEILNNNGANVGNDLLLDDISINACLPIVDLVELGTTNTTVNVTTQDFLVESKMENTTYVHPFFLYQKSINGTNWVNVSDISDLNIFNVEVTNLQQGTTYLRSITGSDSLTVAAVVNGDLSGCYTISERLTVNKGCAPSEITLSAPKSTVHCGEPITLTAAKVPDTGSGEITNWIWSSKPYDASSFSSESNSAATFTVSPTQKMIYQVIGQTQPGCESTPKTVTIDVEMPTISLTPLTQTVCSTGNANLLLTAEKLTGYGNITSWTWSSKPYDASSFSHESNTAATFTVSPTQKMIYQVEGQTSIGCAAAAQTSTIDIYPLVENTLTKDFDGKICGDDAKNITITATATGAVTNSWQYETSGGWNTYTPNLSVLSTIESPAITTRYKFISVGENNCQTIEKTVSIEVNPPFTADLIANPMIAQVGQVVNLEATPSGYHYAWSSNLPQVNQTANSDIPSQSGTKTYTVTVTDVDGACSVTKEATISVCQAVINTLEKENQDKICGDGTKSIVLTATQSGAVSSSWEYRPSSGTWQSFTPNSPLSATVSPSTTTDYKFISVGEPGCNGAEKTVSIEVNPTFMADLTADPMNVQLGQLVHLEATPSGYNYTWSTNLPQVNQATNTDNPSQPGTKTYTVTVTDVDGVCSATAERTIFVGRLKTAITPYIKDIVNDTFTPGYDCSIIVFNRIGQKIFEGNNEWDGTNQLSHGEIADPGVYYYIIADKTTGKALIKGTIEVVKK